MFGYSWFLNLMSDCCEASASAFLGQDDFRNAAEEFRQIFLSGFRQV